MRDLPKIVFVGNYNREDYVHLLDALKGQCQLYFLFFSSPKEETCTLYRSFGEAIYWSDFTSAQQLLTLLRPDKVVFLYVESYNHVVLNLACREASIPTYLLEHGLRADYVVGFDPAISPAPSPTFTQKLLHYKDLFRDFLSRYRTRQFLNQSIKQLQPEDRTFAEEFVKVRSGSNYLETFRKLHSGKRFPDNYIGFSPKQYEAFKQHEAPYFSGRPFFTGIPYFDAMASIEPGIPERAILFIDQPLAEQGLLQWSAAYKEHFAVHVATIAEKHNYKLYVKLHPAQQNGYWPQRPHIQVINDHQLRQLSGSIPVVIGFYSTYLLPFAAFEHTTLITLENHPAGKLDVSKSFVEAGVAHPIYNLDELPYALENIEELHQKQLPNKKQFEQDWMYKFDGKAGERLRDILLSDEL